MSYETDVPLQPAKLYLSSNQIFPCAEILFGLFNQCFLPVFKSFSNFLHLPFFSIPLLTSFSLNNQCCKRKQKYTEYSSLTLILLHICISESGSCIFLFHDFRSRAGVISSLFQGRNCQWGFVFHFLSFGGNFNIPDVFCVFTLFHKMCPLNILKCSSQSHLKIELLFHSFFPHLPLSLFSF